MSEPQVASSEISGRATTNAKASKADVEGATVTAVSVTSDGDTDDLEGEATTDAQGNFDLDVEGTGARGILIVTAEREDTDYESKAIVKVDGRNSVNAAVLTRETTAEALVYLEAEGEDNDEEDGRDSDGDDSDNDSDDDSDNDSDEERGDTDEDINGEDEEAVTAADVVAHVDAELAAEINSGATDPQAVAKAIAASIRAEEAYLAEAQSSVNIDAVEEEKEALFLTLQQDLNAASSEADREAATEAFEERYATAYTRVGASEDTQAKIRQAATSTALEVASSLSATATAEVQQKTVLFRAITTGAANEADLRASGATQGSITGLEEARAAYVAEIRASETADVQAIEDASDQYEADVRTEIENGLEISASVLSAAVATYDSALQTLANGINSTAAQTVQAYATFYGSAETSASTALGSAGVTEADAAASVLVRTSATAQ